jgi:hypothetical protein
MTVHIWGQLYDLRAQGFGVTEIITTPHIIQHVWDNTHENIANKTVQYSTWKNNIKFLSSRSGVPDGRSVCTTFQSMIYWHWDNYVLVEMSYINAPIQLYSILFDLQVAGTYQYWRIRALFVLSQQFQWVCKKSGLSVSAQSSLQLWVITVQITKIAEQLLAKGMYTM